MDAFGTVWSMAPAQQQHIEQGPELHIAEVTPEPTIGRARWRHRFQHKGRTYTLYKIVDSEGAPYYLHIQRSKKRHQHSLETNQQKVAISRAKTFIDSLFAERWDIIDQLKFRKTSASLKQVIEHYKKIAGIEPRSVRNNELAMLLVLRRVLRSSPEPAAISLADIDQSIALRFQDETIRLYCEKAGVDPNAQREARERALRSSRSTICQARCLFSRRPEHDLVARYEAAGLVIPKSIETFMKCKLRGRYVKEDYLAPPDSVVQAAFVDIEKVKDRDPNLYKIFWAAVGAGLRRKEIGLLDWSHFCERDGQTWVSGGIGKNGARIEVPMQTKAVQALDPFRQRSGKVIIGEDIQWASKRLNWWMRLQGWNTEKKLHELRAYVGSLIYRKSPHAAMAFMRHRSIKTTEDFYVRYGAAAKPVDVL
jgi:integrase